VFFLVGLLKKKKSHFATKGGYPEVCGGGGVGTGKARFGRTLQGARLEMGRAEKTTSYGLEKIDMRGGLERRRT